MTFHSTGSSTVDHMSRLTPHRLRYELRRLRAAHSRCAGPRRRRGGGGSRPHGRHRDGRLRPAAVDEAAITERLEDAGYEPVVDRGRQCHHGSREGETVVGGAQPPRSSGSPARRSSHSHHWCCTGQCDQQKQREQYGLGDLGEPLHRRQGRPASQCQCGCMAPGDSASTSAALPAGQFHQGDPIRHPRLSMVTTRDPPRGNRPRDASTDCALQPRLAR